MRGFLVCVVVALVAAPVFAGVSDHTGIIDIKTPGAVLNGNHWEVNPPLTANWFVDIYLTCSDPVGMRSFSITLTGPAGINYAASQVASGKLVNYAGYYAYNANTAARRGLGAGFADRGWDMGNAVTWSLGTLPAGPMIGTIFQGEVLDEEITDELLLGQNGWAAWVKMTTTIPAPQASPLVIDGLNRGMGDSNFDGLPDANILVRPLWIMPEPASALLLLAGLPLLRRRR